MPFYALVEALTGGATAAGLPAEWIAKFSSSAR
jgi:hypothetical protein